jgi:hypothetical protein
MMSCGITKDYGVVASDSASYKDGQTFFDSPKMFKIQNYLVSFIGYQDYFTSMDQSKFSYSLPALSLYMENYLRNERVRVKEILKSMVSEDQDPRLCVFILGLHNGKPTLVQFNSFTDFNAQFIQSDEPEFSGIFYGEEGPTKESIEQAAVHMKELSKKWANIMSPGIMAEILTRGIHFKCDVEEKLSGTKYAGGSVSVASLSSSGDIKSMSNVYL